MKFFVQSACEQGAVRTNNEDAICYGESAELGVFWMLVADGMGGHQAGEVASNILVDYVKEQFEQLKKIPDQPWTDWMRLQISQANAAIFEHAQSATQYQGMGTTGVFIVIHANQANIAWVGDSRAYLLREHVLSLQTQDHTMIQYLLNKGAITADEAEKSNTKNLLSRAVGIKETVEVDVLTIPVEYGDTFLLSTDGLHDYLKENELADYMASFSVENTETNKAISFNMIEQAIAQSSKDNVTLGMIKLVP